jgi:fructose-1,6-bisphosphatase
MQKAITIIQFKLEGKIIKRRPHYNMDDRLLLDKIDKDGAMWYLWSGALSPLYGKNKMATFERYFVHEKQTHQELQNPYYSYRDDESIIHNILAEFGLDSDDGCIINGHVPVRVIKGQSPVKANGKLVIIDGGLAKAYQKVTGIAGFTLIANSRGRLLAEHKPFESTQKSIDAGSPPCSPQMPTFNAGRVFRPRSVPIRTNWPTIVWKG